MRHPPHGDLADITANGRPDGEILVTERMVNFHEKGGESPFAPLSMRFASLKTGESTMAPMEGTRLDHREL